ncbi:uncharacterized protein TNCV_2958791 [Trichonephila clavipes]|nr:uncharacterized protein TNCV_2958791 [Trichonephila clavipes]
MKGDPAETVSISTTEASGAKNNNIPKQPCPLHYNSVSIGTNEEGCGSPVIRVLDHDRYVMSSSPVPLKTHRVGQRCTLNLSRAETSSRWCGS